MDSFKDVLEAAQMYCKAQMAEPTYNLYIDGLGIPDIIPSVEKKSGAVVLVKPM